MDFFELGDKGAELFTLEFMSGSLRKKSGKTAGADPLANRFGEASREADRQLCGRSRHAGFLPR